MDQYFVDFSYKIGYIITMFIVSIIAAPSPKKAVSYDHVKDELLIEKADIIALVEINNPDNPGETATIPMYMSSDSFGVYFAPQMSMNFLEFIEPHDSIDLSKYLEQMEDIKKFHEDVENKTETIEVERKGNISHIKRIIKQRKTEEPKDD